MTVGPGARVGHYEVTALIGEGGMGKVWRAHHLALKRDDALKVLPDAFLSNPERLARFQREAQVLASLNHPNIAHVYGLEQANGIQALVMELVEGPTLADRLAGGAMPVEEALPIARQIAEALEAAHEQGIVHRDLKPANVKVREDGAVKVLDFGLAKAIEPSHPVSPNVSQSPTITTPAMTQMGMILGTAAYMSPEQAKGRPADKRSDVWAFGCVLFEMLTGRRAFDGEDVSDTLAAVLRGEPDWSALPRDVPALVVAMLKRSLRKDRRERVGDVAALLFVLREPALGDARSLNDQPASSRRLAVWRRIAPTLNAASFVLLLVGAMAVWLLWPSRPQELTRFIHRMADGQQFRGIDRPILAISPDGRSFVYNTLEGLYLRSMDAVEGRLIPGTEPTSLSPFFAPDGQSVAYFEAGGQLKRIDINGGAPVVICTTGLTYGGSWGRDGRILFGQSNGIMGVSAAGGEPQLLIETKPGELAFGPQLLPDGDSVLFSLRSAGEQSWDMASIIVQSLSTGERVQVLKGASDGRYVPTGHLLFSRDDTVLAAPFDVDRLELRGAAVPVIRPIARPLVLGPTPAAIYDVSDNGTVVFLEATGGRVLAGTSELTTPVWVDRNGREEPVGMAEGAYTYPRISPDGTLIAIDNRDAEQDLFVWDVRRRALRRFTFDPAIDTLPTWMPDGTRLAWGRLIGTGLNVFGQSSDGTGVPDPLSDGLGARRPSGFTPDGQALVISEGPASSQDLALLSLKERRVKPLVADARFSEFNGVVSPDGRWLAYQSDEHGRFEIFVTSFPAAGQGKWQVSTQGGEEPVWAPKSGAELFYVGPDGAVMAVPVETSRDSASFTYGAPVQVVSGDGYYKRALPQLGRTYDVSPDARRFLRIRVGTDTTNDNAGIPRTFVIVLNWTEELKRRVPVN